MSDNKKTTKQPAKKATKKTKLKVNRDRVQKMDNANNVAGGNFKGFMKDFGKGFLASVQDTLQSGSGLWKSQP
jgi:hypothetical protein